MPVTTVTKLNTQPLRDQFQFNKPINWQINEDSTESGKVDGVNIIARVVGPCFLIDNESLNNRFYSKKLWENCLTKVEEKLENGGLIGTIGHENSIDEKAILEGNISHTVTKLWIDEKNHIGMGEILILGTAGGRELNTLLRAGIPIPVSSRAYGQINGKTANGADLIDEESFILETFDFVLSPGVPQAVPKIVENISKEEDTQMNELTEKLAQEKLELTEKLTEVLTENQKINDATKTLKEENEKLRKAVIHFQKHICKIGEIKELKEGLLKWLQLPPFNRVAKDTGLSDHLMDNVKKIAESTGTWKKICSTAKKSVELAETVSKYEEFGSLEECAKAEQLLKAYIKLGSPKRIAEKLAATRKLKAKVLEAVRKSAARKIGEALDTPAEVVADMLKHQPVKEVIKNLRKIRESANFSTRYESKKINESKTTEKPVLSLVGGSRREAASTANSLLGNWKVQMDRTQKN